MTKFVGYSEQSVSKSRTGTLQFSIHEIKYGKTKEIYILKPDVLDCFCLPETLSVWASTLPN